MLTIALIPVAVLLLVLRQPVIEFVYGRGNFDDADTVLTSAGLAGYSFGLIALALREVVARGLFALRDTRTPTLIAGGGMVVNAAGDVVLGSALGAFGLALTTTLSFTFMFGFTARALSRRAELEWQRWRATLVRVALGAVMLAAMAWLILEGVNTLIGPGASSAPEALLAIVAPSLFGLAIYALALWVLRTPGLDEVTSSLGGLLQTARGRLRAFGRDR